jgi:hypothetical protein
MAVNDQGKTVQAFISNGLSGEVIRLDFAVGAGMVMKDSVTVASGYMHQCDPAALVDAPTGLVYDSSNGTLFVASTLDNAVFAVPNAGTVTTTQGTRTIIYQDPTHLHGALAMAMATNGHLLVTDNDVINANPNEPSEIVEFTTGGQFVAQTSVDPNLGGSFGLGVKANSQTAQLAAVDDNAATLLIWTIQD